MEMTEEFEDVLVVSYIKSPEMEHHSKRIQFITGGQHQCPHITLKEIGNGFYVDQKYTAIRGIDVWNENDRSVLITGKHGQLIGQFDSNPSIVRPLAARDLDIKKPLSNHIHMPHLGLSILFYKALTSVVQTHPSNFRWEHPAEVEQIESLPIWKSSKYSFRTMSGHRANSFRNSRVIGNCIYYITEATELVEMSLEPEAVRIVDNFPQTTSVKVNQSMILSGGVESFCISHGVRDPALYVGTVNGSIRRISSAVAFLPGMNPRKLGVSDCWRSHKLIETNHWSKAVSVIRAGMGLVVAAGSPLKDSSVVSVWLFTSRLTLKSQLTWEKGEVRDNPAADCQEPLGNATVSFAQEELVQDVEIFQARSVRAIFCVITTNKSAMLCTIDRRTRLLYLCNLFKIKQLEGVQFSHKFGGLQHSHFIKPHDTLYLFGEWQPLRVTIVVV